MARGRKRWASPVSLLAISTCWCLRRSVDRSTRAGRYAACAVERTAGIRHPTIQRPRCRPRHGEGASARARWTNSRAPVRLE
ncbi:hypothetical protein C8R46DRAFT_1139557 [Mycena filopes]|nr:hypothetical protein C8R46DRAFT_1139557 [Mycena filopes]